MTTVYSFSPGEITIKFLDDVLSSTVNAQLKGVLNPGIYRGFDLRPGTVDMSITFAKDQQSLDGFALVPQGTELVRVTSNINIADLDLTPWASSTVHFVLYIQDNGATTTVDVELLTEAEFAAIPIDTHHLLLGTVEVPASGPIPTTAILFQGVNIGGEGDGPWTPVTNLAPVPVTAAMQLGDQLDYDSTGSAEFQPVAGMHGWYLGGNGNFKKDVGDAVTMFAPAGVGNVGFIGRHVGVPFRDADVRISIEVEVHWLFSDSGTVGIYALSDNGEQAVRSYTFNPADPITTVEGSFSLADFTGTVDEDDMLRGFAILPTMDSAPVGIEDVVRIRSIKARMWNPTRSNYPTIEADASQSSYTTMDRNWLETSQGFLALVDEVPTASTPRNTLNDRAAVVGARYFVPIVAHGQSGPSPGLTMGPSPVNDARQMSGGANVLYQNEAGFLTSGVGVDETLATHKYKAGAVPLALPSMVGVDGSKTLHPLRLLRKTGTVFPSGTWDRSEMEEIELGSKTYDVIVAADASYAAGDIYTTDLTPLFDGTWFPGLDHVRALILPGSYTVTESIDNEFAGTKFTLHGYDPRTTDITFTMNSISSEIADFSPGGGLYCSKLHLKFEIGGGGDGYLNQGNNGFNAAPLHFDFCTVVAGAIVVSDLGVRADYTEFIGNFICNNMNGFGAPAANYESCVFKYAATPTPTNQALVDIEGLSTTQGPRFSNCLVYNTQSTIAAFINAPAAFYGCVFTNSIAPDATWACVVQTDGLLANCHIKDGRTGIGNGNASFTSTGGKVNGLHIDSHACDASVLAFSTSDTANARFENIVVEANSRGDAASTALQILDTDIGVKTKISNVEIRVTASVDGRVPQFMNLDGPGLHENIRLIQEQPAELPDPATKTGSGFTQVFVNAGAHVRGLELRDVFISCLGDGTSNWNFISILGADVDDLKITCDSVEVNNPPNKFMFCNSNPTLGRIYIDGARSKTLTIDLCATDPSGASPVEIDTGGEFYLSDCTADATAFSLYSLGRIRSVHATNGCAPLLVRHADSIFFDVDSTDSYFAGGGWVYAIGGHVGDIVLTGDAPGSGRLGVIIAKTNGLASSPFSGELLHGSVGSVRYTATNNLRRTDQPYIAIEDSIVGSVDLHVYDVDFYTTGDAAQNPDVIEVIGSSIVDRVQSYLKPNTPVNPPSAPNEDDVIPGLRITVGTDENGVVHSMIGRGDDYTTLGTMDYVPLWPRVTNTGGRALVMTCQVGVNSGMTTHIDGFADWPYTTGGGVAFP